MLILLVTVDLSQNGQDYTSEQDLVPIDLMGMGRGQDFPKFSFLFCPLVDNEEVRLGPAGAMCPLLDVPICHQL